MPTLKTIAISSLQLSWHQLNEVVLPLGTLKHSRKLKYVLITPLVQLCLLLYS